MLRKLIAEIDKIRPMDFFKKLALIIISIVFLVSCDLGTKNIAQAELIGGEVISFLGGMLQFVYAENDGGMLGIGTDLPETFRFIFFRLFVAIILLGLFIYLLMSKNLNKLHTFAYILILSGGLGNLIDRIFNEGSVVDFIVLQFNGMHTGIFNIADVYVTSAVAMIILSNIFLGRQEEEPEPEK